MAFSCVEKPPRAGRDVGLVGNTFSASTTLEQADKIVVQIRLEGCPGDILLGALEAELIDQTFFLVQVDHQAIDVVLLDQIGGHGVIFAGGFFQPLFRGDRQMQEECALVIDLRQFDQCVVHRGVVVGVADLATEQQRDRVLVFQAGQGAGCVFRLAVGDDVQAAHRLFAGLGSDQPCILVVGDKRTGQRAGQGYADGAVIDGDAE